MKKRRIAQVAMTVMMCMSAMTAKGQEVVAVIQRRSSLFTLITSA